MTQPLRILAVLAVTLASAPAQAATAEELDTLFEAIGTPRLMEIMRDEGLMQSDELAETMFPGRSGWRPIASAIYSTDRMTETFRAEFDRELADADVAPLIDFFTSDLGRRIVGLELSAREAFLDPDVEEAAAEAFRAQSEAEPERTAAIDAFIAANDLIELNVMGALNASLAFYSGLTDGDGFEMSREDILSDVWASEPDVRTETTDWAQSYLSMAYRPLTVEEISDYTAITSGDAGSDLNRALFVGFDAVFNQISYDLGLAASRFVTGQDI